MRHGRQLQLWPGRAKLIVQRFDEPRWRVRTFEDNVIRSLRVAVGRYRFVLVLAK
jgi:hypothetical protein